MTHLIYWRCLAGHRDERIFTTYDDSDHSRGIFGCNVRYILPALYKFNDFSCSAQLLRLRSGKYSGVPSVGPSTTRFADLFWSHKKFPKTRNQ